MAIKGGQILHDANGYVIDRIQTAGVGNVNIPEEKVYELGNFQSVGTTRDIPDLSFDLESFDMSCEFEAILTGQDPDSVVDGDEFDFNKSMPIDIISPFKAASNDFDIVRGIAVPYLTLERVTYRFGLRQNATQQFTLRGDSIYYVPGTPYYEEFANVGASSYSFGETAIEYVEQGKSHYALCVTAVNRTDGTFKRLFLEDDYTNTSAGFTTLDALTGYDTLCVVYGSATQGSYPQSVHQDVSVKPAAIRGKDIDVYIGSNSATPVFSRWTSVQSVEVTRSVTLENDEEFGNTHYVSSDYDVPDVTGSIVVKTRSVEELWDKIAEVANIASNKIVGPFTSVDLPVEIRVSDPDTGDVLKTIYLPDCRFTIPGVQGRVQTKQEVTFNFTTDSGVMLVYKGTRP